MNVIRTMTEFDVIIIGAGPAGLSAAIWCADLGLHTLLIEEKKEAGGQLLWTFNSIKNYPGFMTTTARDLRDTFLDQVKNLKVRVLNSGNIVRVDLIKKAVYLGDSQVFSARFLIIATGVKRRTLNIQGEVEFAGCGVLSSGVKDHSEVSGKSVAIVGGGDAAIENAILLSKTAIDILVVHRGERLTARPDFVQTARNISNISFHFQSEIDSITGTNKVTGINVTSRATSENSHIPIDKVLIRIGVVPNTDLFKDQLEVDSDGFVKVDVECRTSRSGVYGVGDVANSTSPCIASAVGMGATAAKSIRTQVEKPAIWV